MTKHGGPDLASLELRLGRSFRDRSLLKHALTHVSAGAPRGDSYQRLEFLGDRVLGLAVADLLYETFPAAHEGELSRRLAELVRRETCAEVAAEWGVAPYIWLGEGEAQSGGAQKAAIVGDICESIIGAVFLDGGYAAAAALVRESFGPRVMQARQALRDPKSALQEWAQGRGLSTPVYRVDRQSGPDHAPHFRIAAEVDGFAPAIGEGGSKRNAEQSAAEAFLRREKIGANQKGSA